MLKKIVAVAYLLLLSGCGGGDSAPPVVDGKWAAPIGIDNGHVTDLGTIHRNGNGYLCLRIYGLRDFHRLRHISAAAAFAPSSLRRWAHSFVQRNAVRCFAYEWHDDDCRRIGFGVRVPEAVTRSITVVGLLAMYGL